MQEEMICYSWADFFFFFKVQIGLEGVLALGKRDKTESKNWFQIVKDLEYQAHEL